MLDFFTNSPWLNILFLVLTIFSIIIAFVFYYKSIRIKRPVYNMNSSSLFEKDPLIEKKLEIKYNGKTIEHLTLTKFAFWNSGREPIRVEDFIEFDPLVITSDKKITIYDFEIIDRKKVNNFSLMKIDEYTIQIQFDYIDHNEGIILNIFHSRMNEEKFEIKGTFIGAKKLMLGIQEDKVTNIIAFLGAPAGYILSLNISIKKVVGIILITPLISRASNTI